MYFYFLGRDLKRRQTWSQEKKVLRKGTPGQTLRRVRSKIHVWKEGIRIWGQAGEVKILMLVLVGRDVDKRREEKRGKKTGGKAVRKSNGWIGK